MDPSPYLPEFQKAASGLDASLLAQKGLQVEVGIWLESVVLRMHKRSWANKPLERPQTEAAIFFSIWVSDKSAKTSPLFYNIHALKLRQLRGYKITSREFAADFRARFQPFARHWPNVSVDFGPLTLMEGWTALHDAAAGETVTGATADQAAAAIAAQVIALATGFLALAPLIDELLEQKKAPAQKRRGS
jgi:hypothetical protein